MKLRPVATNLAFRYGPGQEKLPTTIEEIEREWQRNFRLVRTYGITAVEYDAMLAQQGGGCAICGSTGKTRRLHVEHDHKWKEVKLVYSRESDGKWKIKRTAPGSWLVHAFYNGATFHARERTRHEAVKAIRRQLKRASVRGLCCFGCNGGIRKFRDNALFLERAAKYLTRFQQKNLKPTAS